MKNKFLYIIAVLSATMLISACADDKDDEKPQAQSYDVSGKIDYANKDFTSAKVCLDTNNNGLADDSNCVDVKEDGNYTFKASNNPEYYPLVAYITEATPKAQSKAISGIDSILYAPRGKTNEISINTTFIKSLMEQDSTKSFDKAKSEVDNIIKKAAPSILLNVYNNSLNKKSSDGNNIRGIVGVITNKLIESTTITNDTIFDIIDEEINTIINKLKEEDKKRNLEKMKEILNKAEIKNDKSSPVNLNNYLQEVNHNGGRNIVFNPDAFDGHANGNIILVNTLKEIGYQEEGLSYTNYINMYVDDNDNMAKYALFYNNLCQGIVEGIYYKYVVTNPQEAKNTCMGSDTTWQDTTTTIDCWYEVYNNVFKLEKYYWKFDTSKLDECKSSR